MILIISEQSPVQGMKVNSQPPCPLPPSRVKSITVAGAHHPGHCQIPVLPDHFLCVRSVTVVTDRIAPSATACYFGNAQVQSPDGKVDDVGCHSRSPSPGVIPERPMV